MSASLAGPFSGSQRTAKDSVGAVSGLPSWSPKRARELPTVPSPALVEAFAGNVNVRVAESARGPVVSSQRSAAATPGDWPMLAKALRKSSDWQSSRPWEVDSIVGGVWAAP